MIWYLIMLGAGLLALLWLGYSHQWLMPLDRARIRPEWRPYHDEVPEGPDRVEVIGSQIGVVCRDATELNFSAPGSHLVLGSLAFVNVNGRRLLAVLDRGRRHRTYLVDVQKAAEHGQLEAGMVGWWRHGTGRLLAADDERLLQVHRCFGRDRIYLLEPARALKGQAFGLGIQRTLIAPVRRLGGISLHGHEIHVSAGKKKWKTELF